MSRSQFCCLQHVLCQKKSNQLFQSPVFVVWSLGGIESLLAFCLCHFNCLPLVSFHRHWSLSNVQGPEREPFMLIQCRVNGISWYKSYVLYIAIQIHADHKISIHPSIHASVCPPVRPSSLKPPMMQNKLTTALFVLPQWTVRKIITSFYCQNTHISCWMPTEKFIILQQSKSKTTNDNFIFTDELFCLHAFLMYLTWMGGACCGCVRGCYWAGCR